MGSQESIQCVSSFRCVLSIIRCRLLMLPKPFFLTDHLFHTHHFLSTIITCPKASLPFSQAKVAAVVSYSDSNSNATTPSTPQIRPDQFYRVVFSMMKWCSEIFESRVAKRDYGFLWQLRYNNYSTLPLNCEIILALSESI